MCVENFGDQLFTADWDWWRGRWCCQPIHVGRLAWPNSLRRDAVRATVGECKRPPLRCWKRPIGRPMPKSRNSAGEVGDHLNRTIEHQALISTIYDPVQIMQIWILLLFIVISFGKRKTLRGKSPSALEVARIPATLQTPLKEMKPPASWIRFLSFNYRI